MSEINKLNRLIEKVINEELNELDNSSNKTTTKYINSKNIQAIKKAQQDKQTYTLYEKRKSIKKQRLHDSEAPNELEEKVPEKASDMVGQVSELVDKLNAVSETSENPKVIRMTEKAKNQLDAAKMTLEAIASHDAMMEEKEVEVKRKKAETSLQKISKALKKIIRNDELVAKVMKKFPLQSAIEMLDKQRGIDPETEPDHEKVAEAIAKVALKEGIIMKGRIVLNEANDIEQRARIAKKIVYEQVPLNVSKNFQEALESILEVDSKVYKIILDFFINNREKLLKEDNIAFYAKSIIRKSYENVKKLVNDIKNSVKSSDTLEERFDNITKVLDVAPKLDTKVKSIFGGGKKDGGDYEEKLGTLLTPYEEEEEEIENKKKEEEREKNKKEIEKIDKEEYNLWIKKIPAEQKSGINKTLEVIQKYFSDENKESNPETSSSILKYIRFRDYLSTKPTFTKKEIEKLKKLNPEEFFSGKRIDPKIWFTSDGKPIDSTIKRPPPRSLDTKSRLEKIDELSDDEIEKKLTEKIGEKAAKFILGGNQNIKFKTSKRYANPLNNPMYKKSDENLTEEDEGQNTVLINKDLLKFLIIDDTVKDYKVDTFLNTVKNSVNNIEIENGLKDYYKYMDKAHNEVVTKYYYKLKGVAPPTKASKSKENEKEEIETTFNKFNNVADKIEKSKSDEELKNLEKEYAPFIYKTLRLIDDKLKSGEISPKMMPTLKNSIEVIKSKGLLKFAKKEKSGKEYSPLSQYKKGGDTDDNFENTDKGKLSKTIKQVAKNKDIYTLSKYEIYTKDENIDKLVKKYINDVDYREFIYNYNTNYPHLLISGNNKVDLTQVSYRDRIKPLKEARISDPWGNYMGHTYDDRDDKIRSQIEMVIRMIKVKEEKIINPIKDKITNIIKNLKDKKEITPGLAKFYEEDRDKAFLPKEKEAGKKTSVSTRGKKIGDDDDDFFNK